MHYNLLKDNVNKMKELPVSVLEFLTVTVLCQGMTFRCILGLWIYIHSVIGITVKDIFVHGRLIFVQFQTRLLYVVSAKSHVTNM